MSAKTIYQALSGASGHLTEEGQALYVDALLLDKTDQLPADLSQHVAECHECRREIASLYDMVAENPSLRPGVIHPLFDKGSAISRPQLRHQRTMRRYFSVWSVAATIILVFGLGFVLLKSALKSRYEAQFRKEIIAKILPPAQERFHDLMQAETLHYADNSIIPVNELLKAKMEAMVSLQLRGDDFLLKSPEKVMTVKPLDKITWEWDVSDKIQMVTLMILDIGGINRNQVSLIQKKYQFIVDLPQGQYYWVIVGNGEMLAAGKLNVAIP